MRAASLMVALLASTPALAQVTTEIIHPPLHSVGVTGAELRVRTVETETRLDGTGLAYTDFRQNTIFPFEFSLSSTARGGGRDSGETLIEATLSTPYHVKMYFNVIGAAQIHWTSEAGVDERWISEYGMTDWDLIDRNFRFPPGEYHLSMTQSVPNEFGNVSMMNVVLVIPEPSTWVIAAIGLVVLGLHRAICRKR